MNSYIQKARVRLYIAVFLGTLFFSCKTQESPDQNEKVTNQVETKENETFRWGNANVYFLLTDRFANGSTTNDINFDRTRKTAKLRGFEGGDLIGIRKKIEEGYFTDLGVTAIWMTPIVEQIHGAVDEGSGATYGFHGYWAKDWTAIDPNFGTESDLQQLVDAAHAKGIRILLDAVINHTGPVTENDPKWPDEWVRTDRVCTFDSFSNNVDCMLVHNLPDIRTESETAVALPPQLVNKWKSEGRYEQEIKELDDFFAKTGYPRAPKYYIIKWLTDYVRKFGIDGYRADTVKHIEPEVWQVFAKECDRAFTDWKTQHPEAVLDDTPFYLLGEVYNFGIQSPHAFDFGDRNFNYYQYGFEGMINFDFKTNANQSYEDLFSQYAAVVTDSLRSDQHIMNYASSHDDGQPFDKFRQKTMEAATKLLLTPGMVQLYYGEEVARSLDIPGTDGDATLRSIMGWNSSPVDSIQKLTEHYQKLGVFRKNHPAVGMGNHRKLQDSPYFFTRKWSDRQEMDQVLIGLDLNKGKKTIPIHDVFEEGEHLIDAYSGTEAQVKNQHIVLDTPFPTVLLEKK